MTERIPGAADPFEEEGQASAEPGLESKRITGDPQDDMPVAPERPEAADDWGTTAAEEAEGEPLDVRLGREQPDLEPDGRADDSPEAASPYPEAADERAGRLVAPDEGAHEDTEKDETASDAGTDAGGFTAEERAMHLDPDS